MHFKSLHFHSFQPTHQPRPPPITADTELQTQTVYIKYTGDTNAVVLFYCQSANNAKSNDISDIDLLKPTGPHKQSLNVTFNLTSSNILLYLHKGVGRGLGVSKHPPPQLRSSAKLWSIYCKTHTSEYPK